MAKLSIAELLFNNGEPITPPTNCVVMRIPVETRERTDRKMANTECIRIQGCRKPDDVINGGTVKLMPPDRFNPNNPDHLALIHRGSCFSGSCKYSSIRIPGDTGL